MNEHRGLHIAVIASLKRGLEQFIYREICYMEDAGAKISLYATKYGDGLYAPKASWNLQRWSMLSLLRAQVVHMVLSPLCYFRLLFHAISYGAVADLLLAWCYANSMAQADVIYATFGDRKFFLGYFCKLILDKPLAVTIHAYELYANPNPKLFAHVLKVCDQVITVSEYNRGYLQTIFNVDPLEVEIVRYSIDLDEYQPAQKFIVLIVGFFVKRKGHSILFEAIKQLNNSDIEVWVVGDSGAENSSVDVPGLARDLGIEDQVAFFGRLSNTALRAVYHACDLFCLPCRFSDDGVGEGFPNVLIEAMACGKPIVTTRHVEIPYIIQEVLVAENDVVGLAQAIQQVYDMSILQRKQMGELNRSLAEEHFSTANALKTKGILYRLTSHSGKSHPAKLGARTIANP